MQFIKLQDINTRIRQELSSVYEAGELASLVRILLEDIAGIPSVKIFSNPDMPIEPAIQSQLENAVQKLKTNVPIQYITGKARFLDTDFKVSPAVLIPRSETEELVEWISSDYRGYPYTAMDIGTGSGCIAISIAKKLKDIRMWAMDISPEAIEIARSNAYTLNIPVQFSCDNILSPANEYPAYDLIVSNPPYIHPDEKKTMKANVLDHEPHLALFTPINSPLLYYKAVLSFANCYLRKRGKIYFECNPLFMDELIEVCKKEAGYFIKIKKDMNGKRRMLRLIKH